MKIAGIGDNVIDRYLNKGVMYPGGNAVNVAAHASMLGAQAAYVGEIGNDLGGRIIVDALTALNVDLSQSTTPKDATTKTCDVNVFDGERVEVGYDTGARWAHKTHITVSDIDYLRSFDAVLTSVNAKLQDDVHLLQDLPGVVVYDFSVKEKYRTDEYFDLVCPATTFGLFSCSGESDEQVQNLLERSREHGCSYALATRGAAGPVLFDGSQWYEGKVKLVEALDVVRSEQEADEGIPGQEGRDGLLFLHHAAADGDEGAAGEDGSLDPSQFSEEMVFRVFADRTGVEEDEVGTQNVFRFLHPHLEKEEAKNLGIADIGLTAVGSDTKKLFLPPRDKKSIWTYLFPLEREIRLRIPPGRLLQGRKRYETAVLHRTLESFAFVMGDVAGNGVGRIELDLVDVEHDGRDFAVLGRGRLGEVLHEELRLDGDVAGSGIILEEPSGDDASLDGLVEGAGTDQGDLDFAFLTDVSGDGTGKLLNLSVSAGF